jgi:hypothetical protein
MNNTFQAKRFGRLLRKTFLERKVQTVGLTVLVLGISLMLYAICKTFAGFGPAQNLTFIWGLSGGGCFMASFVFGYFSSNASGISYLTLPASVFEKWLAGILIGVILYPIVFLIFFRLMDLGFVAIFHNSLDPHSPFYKAQYDSVYLLPFNGRLALRVYNIFLIFTSISFLGSLYFNKVSFVKVALVFCAFCFFMFSLNWIIAKIIFGDIASAFPFAAVSLSIGKSMNPEEGSIELPEQVFQIVSFFINYIVPVCLFVLVYLRLREKEF